MGRSRRGSQDWSPDPITSRNDYDTSMAKQRASVMWIVQKANKNKVPAEFQDPYYKDHEQREHLKPGIVSQLANADLYCSALANIYGDPHFFSLSHWKVIQALARKGVYVAEPTDVALNETILLQDSPIKMSAHLAVIEAMMALYIREVVVAERVVSALQKITGPQGAPEHTPQDQEEALVLWVARVTSALQDRIASQVSDNSQTLPQFPRIQDLSDLSDGIGLAALISYYCPHELHWGDIAVADPPSMADSLYNIGLVIKFCTDALPYNPCLLTKEDIVYMHSCVKQNVLAFITELFFLLELQPVSCVSPPNRRASATKYNNSPSVCGASSARSTVSSSYSSGGSGYTPSPHFHQQYDGGYQQYQQQFAIYQQPTHQHKASLGHRRTGSQQSGIKAAGAPSVRRSSSMTLNDVGGADNVGERSFLPSRPRGMIDSRGQENVGSSSHSDYGGRESSMSDGQDGDFVVQRSRGVATLNDMLRTNKSVRSQQEYREDDTQSWYEGRRREEDTRSHVSHEEDTQSFRLYRRDSQYGSIQDLQQTEKQPPAGIPSRFENRPAGRSRSRRNSISADESQLTVENFGGSQDNLNFADYLQRDKDTRVGHVGRRDNYENKNNVIDNRLTDKLQRDAIEKEKREFMFGSKNAIFHTDDDDDPYQPQPTSHIPQTPYQQDVSDSESNHSSNMTKATSFAEMSKLKEQPAGGINVNYSRANDNVKPETKKTTSFGALPNTTTWKQQTEQTQGDDSKPIGDENMEPQMMASELHNVRMKLEEKRRRIEAEKRKMEVVMNKQRQKMGKEVFMQAVQKGDIGTDVSNISKKWLEGANNTDHNAQDAHTPDMDGMDYDQYNNSLSQMTDSLSEIQGDIQRLSSQQHQIQGLMRNGQQVPPAPNQQFYLHDQSSNNGPRRMYPEGPSPDQFNSPSARRAQWGPVRPVPGHIDYYHHPQQQQPGGGPMGYYPQHPGAHPQYQHLPPLNQGGFMLHGSGPPGVPPPHSMQPHTFHQNGGQGAYQYPQDGRPGAPFRLHSDEDNRSPSSLRSSVHSSPNRQILQQYPNQYYGNANSYQQQQQQQQQYGHHQQQQHQPPNYMSHPSNQQPQHQQQQPQHQQQPNIQHQQQLQNPPPVSSRSSVSPARSLGGSNKNLDSINSLHAPVAAPPPDDMEPQNVSFIDSNRDDRHSNRGDSEERSQRSSDDGPTTERLKRMSIGSGTRTYRISTNDRTSPTRPTVGTKTFKVPTKRGTPMEPDLSMDPRQRSVSPPYGSSGSKESSPGAEPLKTLPLNSKPDKGFYISFDDEAPVKPKPPLRSKKSSTGRKGSSQATTPVSEDVNMDFPTPTTQESPIYRLSRLSAAPVGSGSGDLNSPTSPVSLSSMSSPSKRTPSANAPTSPFKRSPLFPTTPLISPTSLQSNGFNYSSNAESSSEVEEVVTPRVNVAGKSSNGVAMVIGDDANNQEECELSDMERKKQKLMYNAMKRKQQQEELKRVKEIEAEQKREKEKEEEERKFKKKEEERQRRELILEKHKIKKAIDEAENEGRFYQPPAWYIEEQRSSGPSSRASSVKMRSRGGTSSRPRPKTMHEDSHDGPPSRLLANRKRGSTQNVNDAHSSGGTITVRKAAGRWGSSQSLSRAAGQSGSTNSLSGDYPVGSRTLDRRYTKRPVSVIGNSNSLSRGVSTKSRASEHDSLLYGMSEDSGLGRATPPRRAPSPGMNRHLLPSPSQPGSLPPGLITRRRLAAGGHHFDDAASDISGTSSTMDFTGPRLYKQPASKSNRPIVLNAVEFCVFPGAVNESNKLRVMEEIARSEAKHFLFLFRDAGCQFRALYSYNLETEEIDKLYGTGPKRITENMFDKFFKYNSGAKNFSKVHTKHITATIDAFTIHNSLWQGRKVSLYSKKDYALVI